MSKIRSKTLSTVSTVAINEALLYKRALCASLDLLLAFFSSVCHRCQQRDSPTQFAGTEGWEWKVSRLLTTLH